MPGHVPESRSSDENPEQYLPGGAVVVGSFDVDGIQSYPNYDGTAYPDKAFDNVLGPDFAAMLAIVQTRFPTYAIDISVRREQFKANDPQSLTSHILGIHPELFEDGFFILSTDSPTVFFEDDRSNPTPARPGDLVYATSNCLHSAPTPDHDGERVRIKFVPVRLHD